MKSNLSIVIPAFNEAQSIEHVLETIQLFVYANQCQVIVVNDGSTDQTSQVLAMFQETHPGYPLKIVTHHLNRGYGGALKSGMLSATTEYLVTMDADGQHNVDDISLLFEKMVQDRAEICIGNRNFKGSSFSRNLIKRLILFFVKKATGITISDLNSGMKLYKTKIVKSLLKYAPNGMPFSDSIVLLHHQFRYKITEQDIRINDRMSGVSTINYRTALYTIVEVLNIIINFFPFRFFFYIALILFMLGLAWGIPLILDGHGLSTGTSFLLLTSLNLIFFGMILENIVRSRFENYHYE